MMIKRTQVTMFTSKDCVNCEVARATLRDAGMAFAITYDVDTDQKFAAAAISLSGKATLPQIFLGTYPLGGEAELTELWETRRLRDIVQAINPAVSLNVVGSNPDTLAQEAQEYTFAQHIPHSDGTQSDDPEQWPILHFYKAFFSFWPNTFYYLHRWPEAYKHFMYCHNMAAIGSANEAFIAHHVSTDRPRTLQRLHKAFAVASGRGEAGDLFDAAEQSVLRLAYLSAQTPLITPRHFAQPIIDLFDADTCIEIFGVCGIAGLVQRFAAIIPSTSIAVLDTFSTTLRVAVSSDPKRKRARSIAPRPRATLCQSISVTPDACPGEEKRTLSRWRSACIIVVGDSFSLVRTAP